MVSITRWNKFKRNFKWARGEYVTILGPKGYGKTTLLLELCANRRYCVIFANKVHDETMDEFVEQHNFEVIPDWNKRAINDYRVVLWPRFTGVSSFSHQASVFRNAINGTKDSEGIFRQGNWTLALDEILYLTGPDGIGLDSEIKMLYTQGRSNGISLIAGSQRPRYIPQMMLDNADHFFYFKYTDEYAVKRLADVTGNIAYAVKEIVPQLRKYQFMYINRESGEYIVSQIEE